jgi:hypothetical protein
LSPFPTHPLFLNTFFRTGLLLQDLTFVNDGNVDYHADGQVNLEKWVLFGGCMLNFSKLIVSSPPNVIFSNPSADLLVNTCIKFETLTSHNRYYYSFLKL